MHGVCDFCDTLMATVQYSLWQQKTVRDMLCIRFKFKLAF